MNNLLNAVKLKFNKLKQNVLLRTVLIATFAILLIFSITLAWYINNLGLWGVQFETGNIEFNAYVYDENGSKLVGPVSSKDEDKGKYLNAPLATIENAQVGTTGTAYFVVESTGSLGIQYKIALDVTGRNESSTAYLGGYKYTITKVTDKVNFSGSGSIDVSKCAAPDQINDEMVTIDRNPVSGTLEKKNGYDVYRFDYTLVNKNQEYTGNAINIYYNIFATQIGGDFEDTEERGYTYYCSTKEDIDRVKVEAYAGDIIKLSSDIVYYGDLVFNKPVSLLTNDFTLTVNGNLIYDYVLGNSLKIDAGGLGRIVVQCTKEGVGGNFTIKAPMSDVTLTGSNASTGDIVVEKKFTVDATNAYGSAGASLNNIRIVDTKNVLKTMLLESNTRTTVSFGTKIGSIQTVVKANNIEIINNGVINEINISNMGQLPQTNSPQIYILNNNDINAPISLPEWSVKFVQNASGTCTGNTRIIQSLSGTPMTVLGNCDFDNDDIEIEKKDVLVEQIEEGNDSRLKIYYQNLNGQVTSIQSILENYFRNEATSGFSLSEVLELQIVSIGSKAITNADIQYMNSNNMLSLKHLDMERADVYDTSTSTYHKLFKNAFSGVTKYETLVLPQSLTEIGDAALANTGIQNIITIPSDVSVFGSSWFYNGQYVSFASSVPVSQAASGMSGTKAIFVEEPYIDSYKSVFSSYATNIYPVSVMDESKQHFIRNTKGDEWEITYYIRGEDSIIGKNITIDGQVLKITSIYDNAYRHNFTASSVVFADSVENLGAGNFYNNKNITYVDLNNLKTIGVEAFMNCSNLAQVEIGNYLEVIDARAFSGCVSLKQEVILPSTMEHIGERAFQQTQITYLYTGGTKTVDGAAFISCKELISAELPEVTLVGEVGGNALFSDCTNLVSVSMPALTKVSGDKMFLNCTSLRELYMSANDDGITLGTLTFTGCNTSLIKLYVPEEHLAFYQSKRPGGINATMIYPQGEKMGEVLVNGFNIGEYIVMNNGDNTYSLVTANVNFTDRLVIPQDYQGHVITAIYANAFRNQSFTDVSLEIGDNIEVIGNSAFYSCSGLTGIVFGDSLQMIDSYAFAYCSGLSQDILLPSSMRRIETDAFRNSAITSINSGGATAIGCRAFVSCTSLRSADFPEVTVVAEAGTNEIFTSCISLVSVNMPKLSKVYGTKMFMSCTSLSEIYMGTKEATINLGSNAFISTNSAQIKLYVPEDLVSFYQGRNILPASQVYPQGEKVGNKAINGYVVGDYVVIPNDDGYTLVTSNLHFEGTVNVLDAYNGKPITEIYANAFRNQRYDNAKLVLGDQVTDIGDGAFYGTTGLLSVTMDNVTAIGENAFYGSGIQVLNAPKLTSVENNAFRKCVDLGVVNIPKIAYIDSSYVFAECTNLKSVYFENVMVLNAYTFQGCKKLEKITINKQINSENMPSDMTIEAAAPCTIYVPYRSLSAYSNPWSGKPVASFDAAAKNSGNTYILSKNTDGNYALIDFIPGKTITSLTLPSTATADSGESLTIYGIQYGAFSAVANTMTSITLSASIAQLDNRAFCECNALTNIYANANNRFFTAISGILYSKDSKMLVKFPTGRSGRFDMSGTDFAQTVGIGASAFENAKKLTEIVFPASLMVIDSTAFENCTSLKTVTFTGNTPPTLMGSGIFDTGIEGFKMVIPTDSATVVTSYLCAYNFAEYEPYIDLGGHAAPGSSTNRNQVPLSNNATQNILYALSPSKNSDEEKNNDLPEGEPTGGEGPDPSEGADETEGAEASL